MSQVSEEDHFKAVRMDGNHRVGFCFGTEPLSPTGGAHNVFD